MREPINCLIIDDNAAVLEKLKSSLETRATFNLGFENIQREVHVRLVHIDCFTDTNGRTIIDGQSLDNLAEALGERIDFVFADFAFISNSTANLAFKQTYKVGTPISIHDCRPFTAYLPDIGKQSAHLTQLLQSFKGRVVVYTNSPPPFDQFFTGNQLEERRREFRALFPKASDPEISIYNLYETFKPDQTVVQAMSPQEFEVFMANVLAMRLNATIMETTYCELNVAQYRRRRRFSRMGIAFVTGIGIALGATTAFFGDVAYHQLRHLMTGPIEAKVVGKEICALLILIGGAFAILWGLAALAARVLDSLGDRLYREGDESVK